MVTSKNKKNRHDSKDKRGSPVTPPTIRKKTELSRSGVRSH